jgi:hypothetical protein
MSQKSNAVRRLGCRRVRRRLQELHDREEAAAGAAAAPAEPVEAAAAACEAHLQGCPACRRFQQFLAGYGRELAVSLEALYAAGPEEAGPEPAAAGAVSHPDASGPAGARPAAAGTASDRDAPGDRDAPARRARRPAARWAVPVAAAALAALAAGTQVPRLAARAGVERRIRREVTILVEAVYSRPLAQGVESALAGGRLLEELAEGDGLQGLGEGEDFPAR